MAMALFSLPAIGQPLTFKASFESEHAGSTGLVTHYFIDIQNRSDASVVITGMLVNNKPQCVQTGPRGPFPRRLNTGDSFLPHEILSRCRPVKMDVPTDQGTLHFEFNKPNTDSPGPHFTAFVNHSEHGSGLNIQLLDEDRSVKVNNVIVNNGNPSCTPIFFEKPNPMTFGDEIRGQIYCDIIKLEIDTEDGPAIYDLSGGR
jgi:hypothetical protein